MNISPPNTVEGSQDGELKTTRFIEAISEALCSSLKIIDKSAAKTKFKSLMLLLTTALSQCPSDSEYLLLDLFNGVNDLAVAVGSEQFVQSQSQISKVMDPLMETLPVHHFFFCSFLSSFDKLCQLLEDNATSLKRSLIKMCIRALRFPLIGYEEPQAARVKNAKNDAFNFVSKWVLFPNEFEDLGEELSEVIIDLIGKENEEEKLKKYVGVLHYVLAVVKRDESNTEPRRIWSKIWKTMNQLIEEDRDRQLTTLCVKEVSICIDTMETEILAETEINEIGLMVEKLLEKETRRRETDPQIEHNTRTEKSGGLLNRAVNIYLRLLQKKVPICNILYPTMPIVFRLIEKCSNKYWGLRFLTILHTYVNEFALEFRDEIVPLLFNSLTDNQSKIRRLAAHSFGQMAESNIAELKEIAVCSLDFICKLMSRPDAKLPGSILATEDAISAVIKIIENCDEKMVGTGRINEILSRFLSWFPLSGVSSECPVAYKFLLDLIDSNHPQISGGEPNTNSPRLLCILTKARMIGAKVSTVVEAIHDEAVRTEGGDLRERVVNKIKEMASSSESLNEWVRLSGLNRDEEVTLRRILAATT